MAELRKKRDHYLAFLKYHDAIRRSLSTTNTVEAVNGQLEIIRRNRAWNEEAARKQLVQFFDAWGPKDAATLDGRRRLSSILFS